LQDAPGFGVCHFFSMADGWEATLLDMAPPHGSADPRRQDTGSPGYDIVLRDTADPGFDPTAILSAAPRLLGSAGTMAGGSRTTAGRVLANVATVGGDMAIGAAMGGTVGSVIPGLGTVIGGAVGAGAGLIGGLVSLFAHHHHDAPVDPVANQLHASAQRDPRRYGPDLLIFAHDPARYHALAREHELPSERWGRREADGGMEAWLRRTHMSQGADLASRYGGRPLAERTILGYAAATDSLQDVEQALDGLAQTPQMAPRTTFRQLVSGMSSTQVGRVAAAFAGGPDSAVETYRAVRRESGDAESGTRARILRALTEQWAQSTPASAALFERLARSYGPDQVQRLRQALDAGDPGSVFRQIEEANRVARDGQMAAGFERFAIEWFAHKADAHPDTPPAETPLRQPENVDVMPLGPAHRPAPARDEIVNLLTDDGADDPDDRTLDTGDARAFAPMMPGAWVPRHWEERDRGRFWGAGPAMAVPTFEGLTEDFEPGQLARLHEAMDRGAGLAVYRRILDERMSGARAARERQFVAELGRIGCVPGQACPIPADRLAGFSPLWASYSPDQVLRIQNALLAGNDDPLVIFRQLERESCDDRVRRLQGGWGQYLTQWNTSGAPNPAGVANYANLVTEQLLGHDTSGFDFGGAIGSLLKGGGGDLAKQAMGAIGSIAQGGGAPGGSPLDAIANLAKKGLGALGGAAGGGGAPGALGNIANEALGALGRAAGGGPLANLGSIANEALGALGKAAGGGSPGPAWPRGWADFGAKVQQGLSGIGLGDLAKDPQKLLALLPPGLGIGKGADPASWWKHLTQGQGLDPQGIQKLLQGVRGMGGPQAIPQLVEHYRRLALDGLARRAREREDVFGQLVHAIGQRYGAASDPWAQEGTTPLHLLTHQMDPAQIERLRDAFASGGDPLAVFRDLERETHEGHAARATSMFKRYLGSLQPTGETGDPGTQYAQGALQQAAAALQHAQAPGFTDLPGLQASLENALGALQGGPAALQSTLGALPRVPGLANLLSVQGALQNALGALQGAQQPGFANPAGLQAALQQVLGALQQVQGAQQVPGLGSLPFVLQGALGALQGAQPPGLPPGFPNPFQQALGGLFPGMAGMFGTETAGPVTEDRRPCPVFHLTLPPMSVPAWKSLYRLVPHKQPIGVQREIAGVCGRARDVFGVDAVMGEYVATPGETPWSIAEKLVGDGRRERELLACNPAHARHERRWRIPPSWFQFIRYVGQHITWRGRQFLDENDEEDEDDTGAPVQRRKRRRARRGMAGQGAAVGGSAIGMPAVGDDDAEGEGDGDEAADPQAADSDSSPALEALLRQIDRRYPFRGKGPMDGTAMVARAAVLRVTSDPSMNGRLRSGPDLALLKAAVRADARTLEAYEMSADGTRYLAITVRPKADDSYWDLSRLDPPGETGDPEAAVPMRAAERPTLTARTYYVGKGESPLLIATKLGAICRPDWWREIVRANPQLAVRADNFLGLTEAGALNIPDAWPASALLQVAPGLGPAPSPVPVLPGPMPAFASIGDLIPTMAGALGVPLGSVVQGASVDPGTPYRIEGLLYGWCRLNPGQSGCAPDFGSADVDGLLDERTTQSLAAWQRWHNARGGSPTLPTDGMLTPEAALALNDWWEAEGHRAVDALLTRKGGARAPQPTEGLSPAPVPAPGLLGGLLGGAQRDLGWLAAQAQQAATRATQMAQQAVQAAEAAGDTPELQAGAAKAQEAAANAAEDAQRAILAAQQATQQGGTAAQQGAQAAQQAGQQAAPPRPKNKGGGDLLPLASLAAAVFGFGGMA
jgi:hypothetical protein